MRKLVALFVSLSILTGCGNQSEGAELQSDQSLVVDGSWDPFTIGERRANRFARAMKGVDVPAWRGTAWEELPVGNIYDDQLWRGRLYRNEMAAPGVPANVDYQGFHPFDEHYKGPRVVGTRGRGFVSILAGFRLLPKATMEHLGNKLFKIDVKLVARTMTASDQQLADGSWLNRRSSTSVRLFCRGAFDESRRTWTNALDVHARGKTLVSTMYEQDQASGEWRDAGPTTISVSHADLSKCDSDLIVSLDNFSGGFHFGQLEVTTLEMR
jgi:hypothetical protein